MGMNTQQTNQGAKRILVTGAAKGIGAAIVRLCVKAGHRIVAVDIDQEGLSQLREELPGIETAILDVRDLAAWERVVEAAETQGGPFDVLINNAGVCLPGPCDQVSADDDRLTIEVNLMGVMNGVRTLLPRFLARKRGHVINVASMAAFSPSPALRRTAQPSMPCAPIRTAARSTTVMLRFIGPSPVQARSKRRCSRACVSGARESSCSRRSQCHPRKWRKPS